MRLFQNDAQLAKALRVLSEAGLIDIVVGADGKLRFQLSAAITDAAASRPRTPSGWVEPVAHPRDGPNHPSVLTEPQA